MYFLLPTIVCEVGRAMIDYKQKSVSGQFIFSAVTPRSSQSRCQCTVFPVSDEAMSGPSPRPLPNVASFAQSLASVVWARHKVRIMHEGMKASAISRHPAVRYKPHFSWIMRVVSDTPHVSLSLGLLIFSSLPKWKGMLTIKHQTLTGTEHGTKGIMAKLMMDILFSANGKLKPFHDNFFLYFRLGFGM